MPPRAALSRPFKGLSAARIWVLARAARAPILRPSPRPQVRDLDKMEVVADMDGFAPDCFTPMHCELNSFDSVRLTLRTELSVPQLALSCPVHLKCHPPDLRRCAPS